MIKTSSEGTSYCAQCESWAKEVADLKELIQIQDKEHEASESDWGKTLREQHLIVDKLHAVTRAAEGAMRRVKVEPSTAWPIEFDDLISSLAALREGETK